MTDGPRFLFYTNELVGFGHLRRQLALATELSTQGTTSLIVTGSPVEPYFSLPPGVDAVKLPTRTRDETGRHLGLLRIDIEALQELRSSVALSAAMAFRPSVVVVEKLPLGIGGELIPTLEALRASDTCSIVLGLRDIDDSPERVQKNWGVDMREAVERYYDAILVYGPPTTPDAIDCMGWEDLRVPLFHVGYVSASMPRSAVADPAGGYVLATTGSGRSGFSLLSTFLEALRLAPLPCRAIVVTGPLMAQAEKDRLRTLAAGLDVEIWEFRTDMGDLIAGALAIVGMAGYNTVAEFIRANKPALLVPRVRPSEEQLIRARLLVDGGLAEMLHPDDLSPSTMRAALGRLLSAHPPRPSPEHFRGTERAGGILAALAGPPRDPQAWLTSRRPKPVGDPAHATATQKDLEPLPLAVWANGATGPVRKPPLSQAGLQ
jgi:predicted glycosyltransferase